MSDAFVDPGDARKLLRQLNACAGKGLALDLRVQELEAENARLREAIGSSLKRNSHALRTLNDRQTASAEHQNPMLVSAYWEVQVSQNVLTAALSPAPEAKPADPHQTGDNPCLQVDHAGEVHVTTEETRVLAPQMGSLITSVIVKPK